LNDDGLSGRTNEKLFTETYNRHLKIEGPSTNQQSESNLPPMTKYTK